MTQLTSHLRAVLIGASLSAAWAGQALAGLEICNDTDLRQSVAIGYKGETDWTSEGWWNIDPGACVTPVPGKLNKRYYYYHARSDGGAFAGQNYVFCTQSSEFTIVGDTDCAGRGFEDGQFREIDTGQSATSFTLTLVDTGDSAPARGARGPGGGGQPLIAALPDETGPVQATPDQAAPDQAAPVRPKPGAGDIQSVNEIPRTPDLDIHTDALTTDLPAGQHGTPFTVTALFQGCELEGGRAYCSFHSDGIKMRAFHSGPTPDELFYALEDMPLNTPVQLTGDQAELRDLHAAVVFRDVQMRPGSDPHAAMRTALQGEWEATDDRFREITIRGSELYERRRGAYKSTRFLVLAQTCTGARGAGPVLIKTALGNKRAECFTIAKADGRTLELTPVKGGAVQSFRRIR